jgi:hypothetical protein
LTLGSSIEATASHSSAFGWNIGNLHGNGADVYFKVLHAITLNAANLDVAFVPTVSGNSWAEVLCRGAISRGAIPTFNNAGGAALINMVASTDFGNVQTYNPNGITLLTDGNLYQDLFYSAILKTWVPSGGAASSTSRQVRSTPSLLLNPNDYLVFHMDHAAVQGAAEMQVCLLYS